LDELVVALDRTSEEFLRYDVTLAGVSGGDREFVMEDSAEISTAVE